MRETIDRVTRADGTIVLSVSGGWSNQILEAIQKTAFDELSIRSGMWPDFEPLVPFASKIKSLSVTSPVESFKGIERLDQLRHLELDDAPSPPLDLLRLRRLESCYLRWHKRYPREFFELPSLRDVTLVGYAGNDCRDLSAARNLEFLDLRQGSLQRLSGIETLAKLRTARFSHIRSLAEISSISRLTTLTCLHIEKCPNLKEVEPICGITTLESLFVDCGGEGFKQSEWLASFRGLVDLTITVPIQSVRWDVIFSLPKLERIAVNTHKGFSASDAQILREAELAGRDIVAFRRIGTRGCPAFSIQLKAKVVH